MNKMINTAILTAGILSLTACGGKEIKGTGEAKDQVRDLAAFTGLNVNGNYEILGSPGSPDKFIISTNENILPYIETKVKDSIVMVDVQKKVTVHPTVTQKIWFTIPKFSGVTLNGSSVFQYQNLEGGKVDVKLSGSHQLLLTGKADAIDLDISGSSEVDARGLTVDDAKVVINGSSTVYLNPVKNLNVTINGEGKVVYFSQSPKVEQKINGSGQVYSNFGNMGNNVQQPQQKY